MSETGIVSGVVSFVSAALLFDSDELFETVDEFAVFEFAVFKAALSALFPQADKTTAEIARIIINFIIFSPGFLFSNFERNLRSNHGFRPFQTKESFARLKRFDPLPLNSGIAEMTVKTNAKKTLTRSAIFIKYFHFQLIVRKDAKAFHELLRVN